MPALLTQTFSGPRSAAAGGDRAWRLRVAHVVRHRPGALAEQLGGLAGRVEVHVRDEHGVAARVKQPRDLAADAAPGAGDDRACPSARAASASRAGAPPRSVEMNVRPADRGRVSHGRPQEPPEEAGKRRRKAAPGARSRSRGAALRVRACRAISELDQIAP